MEDGERCAHTDTRRTYSECQEPGTPRFLAIGDAAENENGCPVPSCPQENVSSFLSVSEIPLQVF